MTTKGDVARLWRVVLIGYVEIISSSDKRSSRASKNRRTITAGTQSHASQSRTSQLPKKPTSTQEITHDTETAS